jgi:hypothetical protein
LFDGWKTKLINEVINQKMSFVKVVGLVRDWKKAWKKSEMLKWCYVVVGLLLCHQRSGWILSLLEMSGRQCEFTWKSWFSRESLDG